MRDMVIANVAVDKFPSGARRKISSVATLIVDGSDLVVRMSEFEKLEAMHKDVRVALSAVRVVRAVDDAWPELRGIRAPGTGIPGVVAVGTRRGSFGKDFAVVHGTGAAVVVELAGASYSRLVVTTPDAESVAAAIQGHLMPSFDATPPPA
jgi:hypothetical protein